MPSPNLDQLRQLLAGLDDTQLRRILVENGLVGASVPRGGPNYPGVSPSNPAIDIPSTNYPDLTAVQVNPSPPAGRITYGSNRVASRTAGQLRGVGRGVQDILPGLLNSIYRGMIVQSPAVTESDLALLQQLGPEFAGAEAGMERTGRIEEILTDLGLLRGGGREITQETLNQMRSADPEFFALREALAKKYGDLLSGIDPNKLTGAEATNVERNLNRINVGQGTANTGSNTAAIKGALQFDDRLQAKRNQLNTILQGLGPQLGATRSGAFNYGTATGQVGREAGKDIFAGSLTGPQNIISNLAQNAFGQGGAIAQNVAQIRANRIPAWQQTLGAVYGGLNAIGGVAGAAAACWVAEELYGINHLKTYAARLYVMFNDNWFIRLYRRYGKFWAKFINKHSWLKPIIKPIWDYMANKGLKMLGIEIIKN